jgi:hypothetical protein
MRLNHDCIRDILLFVEDNITETKCAISINSLLEHLNDKYDSDIVCYHVRQIHKAGFLDNVSYADDGPLLLFDLSWEGHNYVANIRDNNVWSKIKALTNGLASISLPILIDYAKTVAANHLPKF